MSLVEDVLQKVRVHVAQRRMRLDDFFTDFDSLRSGRITAEQFRRALAVNDIKLTETEFEALKNAFAAPEGRHTASTTNSPRGTTMDVRYMDFLHALRAEDPPAELLTTLGRKAKTLSEEEEQKLDAAMHFLRQIMQVRGLPVRKAFEDFDTFRSGKVTISRFRRCLPFDAVREDILQLILKKYGDGNGDVLYSAWCRDLENVDNSNNNNNTTTITTTNVVNANATELQSTTFNSARGTGGKLTLDELLRVLREQFAMYRLRCDDYLRDFDNFRTGFVTAPQFESALGRVQFVNFQLTSEHIETLIRAYTEGIWDDTGCGTNDEVFPRVNYVQFLADTNPRRDDTTEGETNYYETTRTPGQFLGDTASAEHQRAEEVLKKVRLIISSNRINLVPTLHDFDRVRKGIYEHRTCTKSRFERSLATNKIFLKPEEIALLVKRYVIRNAEGGPSDEVNYYQFVMDVDQVQKPELNPARLMRSMAMSNLQQHIQDTQLQPAETVSDVLSKIAAQAEERHLRVNEFFLDFDPLRSGVVQTEKFAVALGIAGVELQAQELKLLQEAYKSIRVSDHIDVNQFVADLGEIAPMAVPSVTTKFNLSVSENTNGVSGVSKITTSKDTVKSYEDNFTEAEREQLHRLLARLSHYVIAQHALLTPFFADFDRFHLGKITKTNFMQALARHRFILSPEETKLLTRYYAVPHDTERIDYTRFVRDVGFNESAVGISKDANVTMPSVSGTVQQTMMSTTGGSGTFTQQGTLDENLVEQVLKKICCFLQERNARLSEFFPDGDELRHRHVTNTRFRHCLSILGLDLTEEELRALELAFAQGDLDGYVDYPAFVSVVTEKLRAGEGIMAVTQRRRGSFKGAATATANVTGATTNTNATNTTSKVPDAVGQYTLSNTQSSGMKGMDATQEELYASAIDKVRRTLAARRTGSLAAFRQYDRARKGFVKEGQFFATLMSLGVQLSPMQSDALRKVHSIGGGEMGYTKFSLATDDPRFT
ncbi:uncharacterized protein TM35_000161690 [Trypanosoma theileri]|uniref:EF-hand domain-containing protein n=1 Tax=Trypanosoma theileri TaxID=67003 RepID=A0A1X0NV98_9TRYP|nr:uncharacterized protein TM35_000161690 [Trypanosoma theileri]ORC88531.1 hypothetical protein TM35_000161690 [Trypanosoma theileri]